MAGMPPMFCPSVSMDEPVGNGRAAVSRCNLLTVSIALRQPASVFLMKIHRKPIR